MLISPSNIDYDDVILIDNELNTKETSKDKDKKQNQYKEIENKNTLQDYEISEVIPVGWD